MMIMMYPAIMMILVMLKIIYLFSFTHGLCFLFAGFWEQCLKSFGTDRKNIVSDGHGLGHKWMRWVVKLLNM